MKSISYTIPGQPRPWKRVTRGWNGSTYVPKDTVAYERLAGLHALKALKLASAEWPRDAWYFCTMALHTKDRRIPDCDNVSKAILDGCHGVLWENDRRVIAPHPTLVEVCSADPRVDVVVAVIDPPRGWEKAKKVRDE